MLKSRKITVLFIVFIAVIFLLPDIALAQTDDLGINALEGVNLAQSDLKDLIANIINIALGFLGVLAVGLILYGGWVWMTSQGVAADVDRAKKIILNAVIGLIVILASYAIAQFVLRSIYGATYGGGGGGDSEYGGGIGLGGGGIESHYPGRNATDIPRNTNIYITFKEAINIDSLIVPNGPDCDFDFCAHPDHLVLRDVTNDPAIPFDNSQLKVEVDAEHKVFGFNPYSDDAALHLGSPNDDTQYDIFLSSEIEKEDGEFAFGLSGYDWDFTVSNELDLTPPTVSSVIPIEGSTNARNTVVQMNFSEAINPLFAAGTYDGVPPDFTNIMVARLPLTPIEGTYTISNQYRTVEFLTDDLCGVNSCGGNVYCLPATTSFITTITDNIRDMADNQLDGDNNGDAGGDYTWHFQTNDTIDLDPPIISHMDNSDNVNIDQDITVNFNKALMASSIKTDYIGFVESPATPVNYWLSLSDGSKSINILHDDLSPSTNYLPTLSSGIQDLVQNCWNPCVCEDPGGSCSCDMDDSPDCQLGQHCEGDPL